jgi:hypothetical protein
VLLKRGERDELERTLVRGCQHNEGGRPVLMSPQPVRRGHTPAVAGREPGETVLGPRSYQVVADLILMLEERGCDHRAERVAPEVLGTRATAPIPVKTGEGIKAAGLKLSSQHIAIGH